MLCKQYWKKWRLNSLLTNLINLWLCAVTAVTHFLITAWTARDVDNGSWFRQFNPSCPRSQSYQTLIGIPLTIFANDVIFRYQTASVTSLTAKAYLCWRLSLLKFCCFLIRFRRTPANRIVEASVLPAGGTASNTISQYFQRELRSWTYSLV